MANAGDKQPAFFALPPWKAPSLAQLSLAVVHRLMEHPHAGKPPRRTMKGIGEDQGGSFASIRRTGMTKSFSFGLLTASMLALSAGARLCGLRTQYSSYQRFPFTHRIDQQVRLHLLGRGGRQEGMLRRRRPPEDRDRPASSGAIGQECPPPQCRRQFPGLALLHDLQGSGRSRIPEPDEVRRHDRRQS
ncbi:hypothetical protein ACVMH6_006599 [Rhizobium leguminosarum]